MEPYESKMNSKSYLFFEWVYRLIIVNILTILISGILFILLALMISNSFWKAFLLIFALLLVLSCAFPSYIALISTIKAPITDGVWKIYFVSFKKYYFKAFKVGLILEVVLGITCYSFYFYLNASSSSGPCEIAILQDGEQVTTKGTYDRNNLGDFIIYSTSGDIIYQGTYEKKKIEIKNADSSITYLFTDYKLDAKNTIYSMTTSEGYEVHLVLTEENTVNSFLQIGFWIMVVGLIVLLFLFIQVPMLFVTFPSLSVSNLFRTSAYVSIRYVLTTFIFIFFLFLSLSLITIFPLLFSKYFVGFVGTWTVFGISLPLFFAIRLSSPIYYQFQKLNIEKIFSEADADFEEGERNGKN